MRAILTAVLAILAFAPAAPAKPRVLMLLANEFNAGEHWQPYFSLVAAGYAVDIASPARGPVAAGAKTRELDATANLSLDEVNVDDYLGLVIPGGSSPANLEKSPRSIGICGQFLQKNKPVSAICHGPRLLLRTGLMKGRVATCLWKVKDELSDIWSGDTMFAYIDQAVVIDGNLLTSRYPNDAGVFAAETLKLLESAGGIALPKTRPTVLVIDPKSDRLTGWAFVWGGLAAQNVNIVHVPLAQAGDLAGKLGDLSDIDAVVVLDGADLAKLTADHPAIGLVKSIRGKHILSLRAAGDQLAVLNIKALMLGEDLGLAAGKAATAAHRAAAERKAVQAAPPQYSAAIAVEEGFPAAGVWSLRTRLELEGRHVAIIGAKKAWVRGRDETSGEAALPVLPVAAFGEPLALTDGAMVVVTDPKQQPWAESQSGANVVDLKTAWGLARPGAKLPPAIIAIGGNRFDDRVVAAIKGVLEWQGRSVSFIAAKEGEYRGLCGLTVRATQTYAQAPAQEKSALVIAPGGLWPDARDADRHRVEWLLKCYDEGATVMAFGFDALAIGQKPQFKGRKFACSDQAVWSFGKEGGGYTGEAAVLSAQRLISAKGADAAAAALRLLER